MPINDRRFILCVLRFRNSRIIIWAFLQRYTLLNQISTFLIRNHIYIKSQRRSARPPRHLGANVTISKWKRSNSYIQKILDTAPESFSNLNKREIIDTLSSQSRKIASHSTLNYLLDGNIKSRAFDIEQHEAKLITLMNVNILRFKYIYNSKQIFLYEQLVSEYKAEYYGRNSDVFFSMKNKLALGIFPMAQNKIVNDNVFSIFGPYYNNYWHFMIEYLPKIFLVPSGGTVLVPIDLRFKSILLEIAERNLINILEIKSTKAIFLRNVTLITTPIRYPESTSTSIDIPLLLSLQSLFKEVGKIAGAQNPQKVFLLRKSIRRVNLDKHLVRKLSSNGFIAIDLSNKQIEYQRDIFSSSQQICAYPGANWANLIFANQSSRYYNLVGSTNFDQSLHHAVATVFGAELNNIAICDSVLFDSIKVNSYEKSEQSSLFFDYESIDHVIRILNEVR